MSKRFRVLYGQYPTEAALVCRAHISKSCENDIRFRCQDAHVAVFDLLHEEVLNDGQIALGQHYIGNMLKEREPAEGLAARDAVSGAAIAPVKPAKPAIL